MTPHLSLVEQRFGDCTLLDARTEFARIKVVRFHLQQIDDALEFVGGPDGQLHRDRVRAQPISNRLKAELKVRPDLVHLVDETNPRHVVAIGLPPDRLGLRLDAFLCVKDGDGPIQHSQRSLDLDGEIHVPGRVDEIDRVGVALIFPGARSGGGLDRDAALLLFGQEIHRGRAFVNLAELVVPAGVVQHALGDGGLAGVDVGADADVTNFGQVNGHGVYTLNRPGRSPFINDTPPVANGASRQRWLVFGRIPLPNEPTRGARGSVLRICPTCAGPAGPFNASGRSQLRRATVVSFRCGSPSAALRMLATQITIGNPMPMGPPIVVISDPKSMGRPTGQGAPRLALEAVSLE